MLRNLEGNGHEKENENKKLKQINDGRRVREGGEREVLSCSFWMIDRSGAWCIHATGSNVRRARRHERDASKPTYPGRFRSSERINSYGDDDTCATTPVDRRVWNVRAYELLARERTKTFFSL